MIKLANVSIQGIVPSYLAMEKPSTVLKGQLDSFVESRPKLVTVLVFIRRAITSFPLRGVEYLLGFIGLVTGFWIGWPWENMYKSDSPVFIYLLTYMPSPAWTTLLVIASLPLLLAHRENVVGLRFRVMGNSLLLMLWVLASLLFIRDRAPYLATAWTPVFAFYQAWSLMYVLLKLQSPLEEAVTEV